MLTALGRLLPSKKNMLVICTAICCALSTGGCDSFLEEDTQGVLTADAFYETEEDVDAAVVACWQPLTQTGWRKIGNVRYFTSLMGSDDLTTDPASNKQYFRETDRFNASSTSPDIYAYDWQMPYESIYAINTLLQNLDESAVSEDVKTQAAAQVRFLRGLLYFRLVRVFGPVPLMLLPEPNYDAERAPVAEVYSQVIEDLTFAESNLPDTQEDPGRPTRWAATSLLARVHITMAGWPLNETSNYALARDKAKEVIDAGRFRLLDDFAALWQIENKNHEGLIYGFQFNKDLGGSYANVMTGNPTVPLEENGWRDVFSEIHFFESFPEGPRKEATFHTVFDDGTHWSEGQLGHPFFAKWRSGTIYGDDGTHPFQSSRVVPIIRYAHILTTYAEAQAMADGSPNAEAYEAINAVRNRAGLPDLTPGLGQMAFRDSVIAERSWEFAAEFVRWWDLVRTEKVVEANATKAPRDMKPLRDISAQPKENFYYMPVPQQEIDLNPNLTQNPGY